MDFASFGHDMFTPYTLIVKSKTGVLSIVIHNITDANSLEPPRLCVLNKSIKNISLTMISDFAGELKICLLHGKAFFFFFFFGILFPKLDSGTLKTGNRLNRLNKPA